MLAQILKSNPQFTHAQATGYISGKSAALRRDKFAGLSKRDWQNATDDYAQGYRRGFTETNNGQPRDQ